MRYWRLSYYTREKNYQTKSFLISESEFRGIQSVLSTGGDFIILRNKPTIKRSLIANIVEATEEVAQMQNQGIEIAGILEPAKGSRTFEKLSGEVQQSGFGKVSHNDFYKHMGWKERKNEQTF